MSRQAFINEMHAINQPEALGMKVEDILDMEIDYPYEMAIIAGEFIDFIGQHDNDYLMLLTTLWDNEPEYKNPKVSKNNITVIKPTINLIGAATPQNLQLAFPVGSMNTGTLSRFLFIHGTPTNKRILIPKQPLKDSELILTKALIEIGKMHGEMLITPQAEEVLHWIYDKSPGLEDQRFVYYNGRRLTHLLKLCMTCAAMDLRMEITERDVLTANTILGMTEHHMPTALGDFGRSRQSATMHAIMEWIRSQSKPIGIMEIFKQFSTDFGSEREFQSCMQDLENSGRLIPISLDNKYLGLMAKERKFASWLQDIMLPEILTRQEKDSILII